MLNVVRTIPSNQRSPGTQPKLIALSTTGSTKASYRRLPLPIKVFYSWLLTQPHIDKFCMERVMAHCAGTPFEDEGFHADILPPRWQTMEGMPAEGSFKSVLVVRAAWLTDGPAKADEQTAGRAKPPYTFRKDDSESLGYNISRQDVAHFVVENVIPRWSEWEGKRASVFY